MDKLNELKALADLAQQLEDNGHFVEANTVHNKFIRLAQQSKGTYTVKGDIESLSDVAANTGFSVQQILGFNPKIKDRDLLLKGQVVNLPTRRPTKEDPNVHIVGPGESLSLIARKKGISLDRLLKLNPGIDPKKPLYTGEKVKIR
jgi:LysM repeat protein